MIEEKYKIRDDESEEEYEVRMGGYHDIDGLTWDEIASIINSQTERNYSESRYRKLYKIYLKGKTDGAFTPVITPEMQSLIDAKIELQKEKVKLSDERIQTNAYVRQLAREETLKEIAQTVASQMNEKKMLPAAKEIETHGKEAILELSDIHYGLCVDNYWNKYNPEIARECITKLRDQTIRRCKENGVTVLHVVELGDAIAGLIHLGLRLESRFDVITQTMEISEIICEMLSDLSQELEVHFYSCLDNHSRLDPNKKDAMDLESLARIIPWYVKTRLGDSVKIHENEFGEDIITFNCMGYNIVGVHGHQDKPCQVVDSLTLMTHRHYDLVCTAHLHHFSADEKNETMVVSNGSILGTDTFAKNLRLSSRASQNLIIVSDESVCECIYRIILR